MGDIDMEHQKFLILSFKIIALLLLLPHWTGRMTIRRRVVFTKGVLFSGQFSSHSEFRISSGDPWSCAQSMQDHTNMVSSLTILNVNLNFPKLKSKLSSENKVKNALSTIHYPWMDKICFILCASQIKCHVRLRWAAKSLQ